MHNEYHYIAKIIAEVAPSFKLTYSQLYFIVYNNLKDLSIKPESITKEQIIKYIDTYIKEF